MQFAVHRHASIHAVTLLSGQQLPECEYILPKRPPLNRFSCTWRVLYYRAGFSSNVTQLDILDKYFLNATFNSEQPDNFCAYPDSLNPLT